jgi:transposase
VDSTPLAVCHNRRIPSHKVFAGLAARGKSSTGWFFGFKLHLVVNDRGELLNVILTPGNTDDRKPVRRLVRHRFGKLFGDRGYLSKQLFRQLLETCGVQLVTKLKARMQNQLLPLFDKVLLRKRAVVESIVDQLKNISQIEHSRHRSRVGFAVNLLAGLIAYCHQTKKPSLHLKGKLAIAA